MKDIKGAPDFKSKPGIKRIFKAGKYSCQGLISAFKNEAAFRQELLLSIVLLIASFFVSKSIYQWLLLFSTIIILLIVELLNSAIESLADAVSPELHPLVGRAKDMGSAAVLLSLILIGFVWVLIILFNLHIL